MRAIIQASQSDLLEVWLRVLVVLWWCAQVLVSVPSLFNPFPTDVESTPSALQLELIDLQY